MNWLESFRTQTGAVIGEPFLLCLAETVAAVESDWGRGAIRAEGGLNEIGYKAVAGRPWAERATREADASGGLRPRRARFRLFRDRAEQAEALLWLMRSSRYYEAARLLYVLAFYSAYAPGREAGLEALLGVFNELARSGAHRGVRPFALIEPGRSDPAGAALAHAAAREGVRQFARLTAASGVPAVENPR
jgi:hypothetical protein